MAQGGTSTACTRSGRTRHQGRWGSSVGTRLEKGSALGGEVGIQPRLGRFPPHSMGVVGAGQATTERGLFPTKDHQSPADRKNILPPPYRLCIL